MARVPGEETFRSCNCEDSIVEQLKGPKHLGKVSIPSNSSNSKTRSGQLFYLKNCQHDLWIRKFDILSNDATTSTLKNTYIRISR